MQVTKLAAALPLQRPGGHRVDRRSLLCLHRVAFAPCVYMPRPCTTSYANRDFFFAFTLLLLLPHTRCCHSCHSAASTHCSLRNACNRLLVSLTSTRPCPAATDGQCAKAWNENASRMHGFMNDDASEKELRPPAAPQTPPSVGHMSHHAAVITSSRLVKVSRVSRVSLCDKRPLHAVRQRARTNVRSHARCCCAAGPPAARTSC